VANGNVSSSNKLWRGVGISVIAVVIIFSLQLAITYFTESGQTAALSRATAEVQMDVVELLKLHDERIRAEDAGVLQDAKRCRQGKITDRDICGAAGVMIPSPH
jgi:anti-sigma-K factor RskA